MAERNPEQSIFLHAVGLAAADRGAYLDEVCRENAQLRAQLEALLAAHDQLGSAASSSFPSKTTVTFTSLAETVGSRIGPYRLMEQIGEGGFGLVFVAEQQEPVRRKVALKVIKPGMDSRQVIARFEAERKALALMDHPTSPKCLMPAKPPVAGRTS
ncbi:MAG: hypothetical protein KatS3mg110_3226 [Pirellulaceae bacterium]|nr:MAG: hypothetical protein KatS3mg110_3226 [Pirellulaceae bacterium]